MWRLSRFSRSLVTVRKLSTVSKGNFLRPLDTFARRHLGPSGHEVEQMLSCCGVKSLDQLISETVPSHVTLKKEMVTASREEVAESVALKEMKEIASQNQVLRSFIGMGYYGTITPPVILRNVLENPAWYTPYTPYQAEISQGRMESLLNFQTMICELTGMVVANASLLDEGTAAAEGMSLCNSATRGARKNFFVSELVHPQTIEIIKTRAKCIGVNVVLGDHRTADISDVCGVLVQYPTTDGQLIDYTSFSDKVHNAGGKVVIACDLLNLTVSKTPGEMGADVVCGNSQRFGVPLGYGGPHAAFFAVKDELRRNMAGRLIGVTRDSNGQRALRLTLQTREQHIRREKATSNICTAQALLANTASLYAVYHGPEGLRDIAARVNGYAKVLAAAAEKLGIKVYTQDFFDTIRLDFGGCKGADDLMADALAQGINLRRLSATSVTISMDETVTSQDLAALFVAMNGGKPVSFTPESLEAQVTPGVPAAFARTSKYMAQAVFNTYSTETEMLRYIFLLASKDLGLVHSMISLGSCTMKLNATAEMIPITWPEFGQLHPFCPPSQAQGYAQLTSLLEKWLCGVTGFAACSLQPNSGAAGEFTGLLAIQSYHQSRGDHHRNVCIIPTSAHGTNPASAALAGLKVVATGCDSDGNIDLQMLKSVCEKNKDNISCMMITYPSTFGVFEDNVKDLIETVHSYGGLVYMDGANMNAQVGLTSPGEMGADVCHLNLHKTFCIPHGGGGPGVGPICVNSKLAPFLPSHVVVDNHGGSCGAVAAAPWGSASILPISWMYIRMMGSAGLTQATKTAILNANYMKDRLKKHYKILYANHRGRVAHEFIVDLRPLKASSGITETDVAKRLQDYGFHSPTMSFPVAGTLMIEPTESEPLAELDRFVDAMISIRKEIQAVDEGTVDKHDNVLKNAPHTMQMIASSSWTHPYSRDEAAYPLPYLREAKFWPTVGRVDDVYGDRNLFCTCDPVELK